MVLLAPNDSSLFFLPRGMSNVRPSVLSCLMSVLVRLLSLARFFDG